MSAAQFVEMASELLLAGYDEDYDVPELWSAISALPKADVSTICRFIGENKPRSALVRGVHRFAEDTWHMLLHLTAFHAGGCTEKELVELASIVLARHSQSAIVTGYVFHVKRVTTGDTWSLADYVCTTPFEQLDVLEQSSHLCCASWLHKSAGNMATQSHEEVWNSDTAEAIRQSVLDGSYRFCSKTACPKIPGKDLTPKAELMKDPWWRNVIENHLGKLDRGPKRVNLAYDKHCNLSCPSCRDGMITSDDAVRDRLDGITQRNIFPLLQTSNEAFLTGSGDPFASRTFRKILSWISEETCPNLQVVLMTNGMLFTEKEWAKFPNLHGKVKLVKVSMDGATKTSHETLRRGSKWETMMKNLPFIGTLLQKGDIASYELVFVVQKENFAEMGDFVDLAKKVGANRVYFERITNWGTFSNAQYEEKAVFNPTHPQYEEFLAAVADPRLRDPMVLMGSLGEFL